MLPFDQPHVHFERRRKKIQVLAYICYILIDKLHFELANVNSQELLVGSENISDTRHLLKMDPHVL